MIPHTSVVTALLMVAVTALAVGQSPLPPPTPEPPPSPTTPPQPPTPPQADSGVDSMAAGAVPDSVADSAAPAPPPTPTPEQDRYMDGLRRVGRGVAQLKTAIDRVARSEKSGDTVSQRRDTRRLGGYCGSARAFMTGGRARMQDTAYPDTTGMRAKLLTRAVDDLIKYAPICEAEAAADPAKVVRELVTRLRAYDGALADFREAIGLPSARDG